MTETQTILHALDLAEQVLIDDLRAEETKSGVELLANVQALKRKLRRDKREDAPTVSLTAAGDLQVYFSGVGDGHFATFPCTEKGAVALRKVLEARAHAGAVNIATNGAPVQAMVDAWLKENTVKRKPDPDDDLPAYDFDLNLEGIEL